MVLGSPDLENELKKYNKKEIRNFYSCIKNYIRKINKRRKIHLARSELDFAQLMALSETKNDRLKQIMCEHRKNRDKLIRRSIKEVL